MKKVTGAIECYSNEILQFTREVKPQSYSETHATKGMQHAYITKENRKR